MEIGRLNGQELGKFKELIRVFNVVFDMENFHMPADDYLQQLLQREDFYVFVALANNQVIGGLTAYALQQYYAESPLVYIYDLAVKTEFQRQGVGKTLITAITDYCKHIGVEEVFVQVDVVDKHAIDFYQRTGATAEKVVHFYYPLHTH